MLRLRMNKKFSFFRHRRRLRQLRLRRRFILFFFFVFLNRLHTHQYLPKHLTIATILMEMACRSQTKPTQSADWRNVVHIFLELKGKESPDRSEIRMKTRRRKRYKLIEPGWHDVPCAG